MSSVGGYKLIKWLTDKYSVISLNKWLEVHLLHIGYCRLVVLRQLQGSRNFGRIGDNLGVELTALLHQTLLTVVRLEQSLVQLFVLHPKLFQTLISRKLFENLSMETNKKDSPQIVQIFNLIYNLSCTMYYLGVVCNCKYGKNASMEYEVLLARMKISTLEIKSATGKIECCMQIYKWLLVNKRV